MKLGGSQRNLRQAQRLRRELTLPEIVLWRELRLLPIRVRKQVPADPYILDFNCARARLAIEVDGEAHDRDNRPERDIRRDAWLADRGIVTLRIRAIDVLDNLDGVMQFVIAEIAARGGNQGAVDSRDRE